MTAAGRTRGPTIRIRSPAKLNLFLEVTGRRLDGYHELETVMVRTDVCDSLTFERRQSPDIELSLVNPPMHGRVSAATGFPLDSTNLIMRAAHALQELTGCSLGAHIRVHKRIPGQAGLGGGSGNAAVTLRALNELWQLNLPAATLHAVAATLGSDVNFLLSGSRAAICTGRGEKIQVVDKKGTQHGVLLVPATGNSTAEIFRSLVLPDHHQSASGLTHCLIRGLDSLNQAHCFNRLQNVAAQLNPAVSQTLSWLKAATGFAHLTGSGSGCFSVVPSALHARRVIREFVGSELVLATTFRI